MADTRTVAITQTTPVDQETGQMVETPAEIKRIWTKTTVFRDQTTNIQAVEHIATVAVGHTTKTYSPSRDRNSRRYDYKYFVNQKSCHKNLFCRARNYGEDRKEDNCPSKHWSTTFHGGSDWHDEMGRKKLKIKLFRRLNLVSNLITPFQEIY